MSVTIFAMLARDHTRDRVTLRSVLLSTAVLARLPQPSVVSELVESVGLGGTALSGSCCLVLENHHMIAMNERRHAIPLFKSKELKCYTGHRKHQRHE